MSVAEDRRRVALRLNVLQWGAVVVFAALAMSFWFLQVVQHAALRGDGREQPPADAGAAGAARRAVRPQRHGAGREPALVHHLDRPRALQGPGAHGARCCRRSPASIRSRSQQIVDRHRSEPAYRPIVVVEDASLAQVAAVTRAPARFRAARRRGRGSADAALSRRRAGGASLRLRRRGQRRAGRRRAPRRARSSASRALEKAYNKLLMGRDGAKRVVVNSVGREIRTLEEVPPVEGRRVQLTIDADLQTAAEDGFRHAGFNGAALILDPRNGEVLDLRQPAGLRPQRLRRRASTARPGRRSTPTSCGRCRTA